MNFGRAHELRPAEIPYAEAQRVYAEAASTFKLADTKLPLSEAAFRRALTPENMVTASQGLGGPQPAEVTRMLAAEKVRLADDRAWLEERRTSLASAARKLDDAFAQLRSAK